jgi:hypothetical protein
MCPFDFITQVLKEDKDRYVPISTSRQFSQNRQILPWYIVQTLKEKGDRCRERVKFKTLDSL